MYTIWQKMKAEAEITEELKAINPLEWIGFINNIRNVAEEIVLREIIYV